MEHIFFDCENGTFIQENRSKSHPRLKKDKNGHLSMTPKRTPGRKKKTPGKSKKKKYRTPTPTRKTPTKYRTRGKSTPRNRSQKSGSRETVGAAGTLRRKRRRFQRWRKITSLNHTLIISFGCLFVRYARLTNFYHIFDVVESSMKIPKIIVDGMSAALESDTFNFSEASFEAHARWGVNSVVKSFNRTGFRKITVFSANSRVDQFMAFAQFEDGRVTNTFRWRGKMDTDEDVILLCDVDPRDGLCISDIDAVPWSRNTSITEQSRYIYEKKFVSPYLFFCPGPDCDLYFAYTHPFHKNGEYIGTVGCAFESNAIIPLLEENTDSLFVSFIFDIKSGFMIATSNGEPTFIQPDQDHLKSPPPSDSDSKKSTPTTIHRIKAVDHPSERIRKAARAVGGNFLTGTTTDVEPGVVNLMQTGKLMLEYRRYVADGADWMCVSFGNSEAWNRELYVFGGVFVMFFSVSIVLFSCIFLLALCCISMPINNLAKEMKKIKSLDFSSIRRRHHWMFEVRSLEESFYFALDRLQELQSFLPHFLQKNKKQDIEGGGGGGGGGGGPSNKECGDCEDPLKRRRRSILLRDSPTPNPISQSLSFINKPGFSRLSHVSMTTDSTCSLSSQFSGEEDGDSCFSLSDGWDSDPSSDNSMKSSRNNSSLFSTRESEFGLNITSKKITMVTIGFPLLDSSAIGYLHLLEEILEKALDVSRRGFVHNIAENRISVVIHATLNCSAVALSFAVEMKEAMEKINVKTHMSLVTGMFNTGIVGCQALKVKSCFGASSKIATALCSYAEHHNVDVLLNAESAEEISRCVDSHVPVIFDVAVLPNVLDRPLFIYSVTHVRKPVDSEWMYVVDYKERLSSAAAANLFVLPLISGDLKNCIIALTDGKGKFAPLKRVLEKLFDGQKTFADFAAGVAARMKGLGYGNCITSMNLIELGMFFGEDSGEEDAKKEEGEEGGCGELVKRINDPKLKVLFL